MTTLTPATHPEAFPNFRDGAHDDSAPVIPWGPSGQVVFDRTYSRPLPNGSKETWPETCGRVVDGNLSLVYGPKSTWTEEVWYERDRLLKYMIPFGIIPAGRHLWASGVKGRQYLFNCHHSGWSEEKLSRHFEFQAERLFEGGGVGANYSMSEIGEHRVQRKLRVHVVCDPDHDDYQEMLDAGLLSTEYTSDWAGAFEVEDTREGWSAAMVDLIDTFTTTDHVQHENRVIDVSRVRRKGSRLKSSGGTASGPLPLAQLLGVIEGVLNNALYFNEGLVTGLDCMDIDHAIASAVVAGGTRRSARMAMMHWKDPYIFEFLQCKEDGGSHWTTNISVVIDNEFLHSLGQLSERLKGPVWRAHAIHQAVVQGMLTNGEPGYWNIDKSNEGEPNRVTCTNPCGEIALEEFENCNLGHVNLDYFAPKKKGGVPDRLGLDEAHVLMTRFLIRATFGDVNDDQQADVLARNRRIGVGHLGVQAFWAKRGIRYSKAPKLNNVRKELRGWYKTVREAARIYCFELRIPECVKVTTVAPTGSISKLPGTTEGIHPVLFRFYLQGIRFVRHDPEQMAQVEEARAAGLNVEVCTYDPTGNTIFVQYPTKHKLVAEVEALGYEADIVEIAGEIDLADMLAVQALYQDYYADNAVSFTANVPAEPHQQDQMLHNPFGRSLPPSADRLAETMRVIEEALPRLKGTTIMVDGARVQAPYTAISQAEFELWQYTATGDGLDEDCATGACPVR